MKTFATVLTRIGAADLALTCLGWAVFGVIGVIHLVMTGQVWEPNPGMQSYYPRAFIDATHAADGFALWLTFDLVFIAFCALGIVGAGLIWSARAGRTGYVLAAVAIAGQAFFWWAFVLPFGPPGGAVTVGLLVIGAVLQLTARRREHDAEASRLPTADPAET